jgi:hypothetical protein
MSDNNPKRHRDAGSGHYVTEDYAEANPDTTVSETSKQPDVWKLLTKLSQNGGAIVREQDLSAEDLEKAKAEQRHWGGFVYEPIEELTDGD